MLKIILTIIVILLFRRLIQILGFRGGRRHNTNQYSQENPQEVKTFFHEENQPLEYKFCENDKKILALSKEQVQNQLNIIINYIPDFQLYKFVQSASKSLQIIYEILIEKASQSDSTQEIIPKLQYLVESSYVSILINKQFLITKYIEEIKQLKLKQIYLLSTKTFILLTTNKEDIEFTFTKNLKHSDKNWYLSKIEAK